MQNKVDLDVEGERFPELLTKDITIISSLHGRQRRDERGIVKEELQAAIKHGKCEKANPGRDGRQRWKFTHNGCVYVTDASKRHEITSWKVSQRESDTEEVKNETGYDSGPGSHIVLLVDSSGSMRKDDVPGYSTRTEAVYDTLVQDFVKPQLESSSSQNMLVTLIEMSSESRVIFKRQAVSKRLCQQLDLRKRFRARMHGNYLPALDAVREALLPDQQNQYQLFVVFLSDGAPSDHCFRECEHGVEVWQHEEVSLGAATGAKPKFRKCQGNNARCRQKIVQDMHKECLKKVTELGTTFGMDRIYLATVAFGAQSEDYSVLRKMATQLPRGSFQKLGLSLSLLRTHLTSLTGTLTTLCTEVMSQNLTVRTLQLEHCNETTAWLLYSKEQVVACLRRNTAHHGAKGQGFTDARDDRVGEGIQIAALPFEKGAEWVVSRCREVIGRLPMGPNLVAKQPLHEELLEAKEFYLKSCRVQSDAAEIAELFNRRLQLGSACLLTFVSSRVYKVDTGANQSAWYKVEEELTGQWTKWNDNSGRVVPWYPPSTASPQTEAAGGTVRVLEVIGEDENPVEVIDSSALPKSTCTGSLIEAGHIPQCFSHFSHTVSEGKKLVCDLQGAWNSVDGFTLTDPVVHYASWTGRRCGKNGRTDKGVEGMRLFFMTHTCNPLCRRLGLEPPRDLEFLLPNAILDFFERRNQVGKRRIGGWAWSEILHETRASLNPHVFSDKDFNSKLDALVQNGVLICRGWPAHAPECTSMSQYTTFESHVLLRVTGRFFSVWSTIVYPPCPRSAVSNPLFAWRSEVDRAQTTRKAICLEELPDGFAQSRCGVAVVGILKNLITANNVGKIARRIQAVQFEDAAQLHMLAHMILNLAVAEPVSSQVSAQLCVHLYQYKQLPLFDLPNLGQVSFIRCLNGVCQGAMSVVCEGGQQHGGGEDAQEERERAKTSPSVKELKQRSEQLAVSKDVVGRWVERREHLELVGEHEGNREEENLMLASRGVVKFVVELFLCNLLDWRRMQDCVKRLSRSARDVHLRALCVCELLITAGPHRIRMLKEDTVSCFEQVWPALLSKAEPRSLKLRNMFQDARAMTWNTSLLQTTKQNFEESLQNMVEEHLATHSKCSGEPTFVSLPRRLGEAFRQRLCGFAATLDDIRCSLELLDWNLPEDVRRDGGVMCQLLGQSEGLTGNESQLHRAMLTIDVEGKVVGTSQKPFMSLCSKKMILGNGELPWGLELCLEKMKKGQGAVVTLQSKYAFAEAGKPEIGVSLQATVEFFVLVRDVTPEDQLPPPEKVEAANAYRMHGNRLFNGGDYVTALHKYERALALLLSTAWNTPSKAKAKAACHLNRAACFDKLGDFQRCCSEANAALVYVPSNVKALYRRGKAQGQLGRADAGLLDVGRVLELEPQNAQAQQLLVQLRMQAEEESRRARENVEQESRRARRAAERAQEELRRAEEAGKQCAVM